MNSFFNKMGLTIIHYSALMDKMVECTRSFLRSDQKYIGISTDTLSSDLQLLLNSNCGIKALDDRVGVDLEMIRKLLQSPDKFWFNSYTLRSKPRK